MIASGGGFSVDASVAVETDDRAGFKRLLRYCSPSAFSAGSLRRGLEGERVVYRLPKPRPDGTQHVALAVSELFYRLAALIPPPRRHRHRYHGLLARYAVLRRAVTARWASSQVCGSDGAPTERGRTGRSLVQPRRLPVGSPYRAHLGNCSCIALPRASDPMDGGNAKGL